MPEPRSSEFKHDPAYITDATRDAIAKLMQTDGVTDPLVHEWLRMAIGDINAAIPKAREYGSVELRYLGTLFDSMAQHPMGSYENPDAAVYETAIAFYLVGKVGRWVASLRRGEFVSDDTLLDIATYANMARLIRKTGGWT